MAKHAARIKDILKQLKLFITAGGFQWKNERAQSLFSFCSFQIWTCCNQCVQPQSSLFRVLVRVLDFCSSNCFQEFFHIICNQFIAYSSLLQNYNSHFKNIWIQKEREKERELKLSWRKLERYTLGSKACIKQAHGNWSHPFPHETLTIFH